MLAPLQAALLALALSMAGNAALGWAWQGARDAKQAAVRERDDAQAAAQACTAAVNGLSRLAIEREASAKTAREAARAEGAKLARRADRTLSKAPAVPGDMCKSMQALGDEWLRERGQ